MTYVSIILYQEWKNKTVFLKRHINMYLKLFDCYVWPSGQYLERMHSLITGKSVFYVCWYRENIFKTNKFVDSHWKNYNHYLVILRTLTMDSSIPLIKSYFPIVVDYGISETILKRIQKTIFNVLGILFFNNSFTCHYV